VLLVDEDPLLDIEVLPLVELVIDAEAVEVLLEEDVKVTVAVIDGEGDTEELRVGKGEAAASARVWKIGPYRNTCPA
jgi:hypothetical protein